MLDVFTPKTFLPFDVSTVELFKGQSKIRSVEDKLRHDAICPIFYH